MIVTALSAVLLLAPGEPDELDALQTAVRIALEKAGPCVVRIETVGGVPQVRIPKRGDKKMTVPQRPGEGEPRRPEPEEKEGEEKKDHPREGRTPRFKNEFEKMLALPGFKKAEGPTTGVILSADGYIITSAWNFERKPQAISVTTSDGKTYAARMLGVDKGAGLALIKIEAEGLPLPTFIDPDQARVGAWAFALGRALTRHGVEVKYGILSAKNRIGGDALQTDVATSPGNYGGPLVDVEGRVYGIIVPLGARGQETNPNWYDSGIGFAAPIRDPRALIEKLGKEGTVLRPAFLGVQMDQDRTAPGALITEVLADQAAAKAGLEKDDVILVADGTKVVNAFTLRFALGRRRAGETMKLVVQRGEKQIRIDVKLGTRPEPKPAEGKLPERMPGQRPQR